MEKIASFIINHDLITLGMFTSRTDDDIITYDIRMALPNAGNYLGYDGVHTFEHLFATYARNSRFKNSIIYVGPMGCRTGFYLLVRDSISPAQTIAMMREVCDFITDYQGEIPGSTPMECGNAKGHSLPEAKAMARTMGAVLQHWTVENLVYPT